MHVLELPIKSQREREILRSPSLADFLYHSKYPPKSQPQRLMTTLRGLAFIIDAGTLSSCKSRTWMDRVMAIHNSNETDDSLDEIEKDIRKAGLFVSMIADPVDVVSAAMTILKGVDVKKLIDEYALRPEEVRAIKKLCQVCNGEDVYIGVPLPPTLISPVAVVSMLACNEIGADMIYWMRWLEKMSRDPYDACAFGSEHFIYYMALYLYSPERHRAMATAIWHLEQYMVLTRLVNNNKTREANERVKSLKDVLRKQHPYHIHFLASDKVQHSTISTTTTNNNNSIVDMTPTIDRVYEILSACVEPPPYSPDSPRTFDDDDDVEYASAKSREHVVKRAKKLD